MPGFLASGGEKFNLGLEMRLDRSELLCNKVLLKYKGDRETMEIVTDFIFGGGASKITADGDCSHEIKGCLLLGRKVMTKY